MGVLAELAFAPKALRRAWDEVLENDLRDGVPSVGVSRFAENLAENLEQLSENLGDGTFLAGRLSEVKVQLGSKLRTLHIPRARDRVVARAVLDVVTPVVDPALGHGSYAYRPGLGVADAVQAVVALREEGLRYVLRTDIKDCFPTVPKRVAVEQFSDVVHDDAINAVVSQFVERSFRADTGGLRVLDGLPQGCPLSPLLANLVLGELDQSLAREGFPTVRYGDDMVVAACSFREAGAASRAIKQWTERHGMSVNEDKTRVATFEEGFTFLGEDFGPRYPPRLEANRVPESWNHVLYVGMQGAGVLLRSGRIRVLSKNDAVIRLFTEQGGFGAVSRRGSWCGVPARKLGR